MTAFLLWILLLLVCWPAALVVLVAYPLIWVVMLPFRLVGVTVDAALDTVHSLISLPARVLRRLD